MNNYSYAEIRVGMEESFKTTVTEEKMTMFRTMTGDVNPLHNDEDYAASHGYEGRVVFGMLTASMLSTLAGVYLPGEKCLIHSVEVNFMRPVMIGDELTVKGKVYEINDDFGQITLKVEIFDQNNKKVVLGKMKVGVLDE